MRFKMEKWYAGILDNKKPKTVSIIIAKQTTAHTQKLIRFQSWLG
ncbi:MULTISPECIES: hypothetical protein [unclassified Moraxella]